MAQRLRDCGEGFRDLGQRHLARIGVRRLTGVVA
jgi:hypothetical protein